MTVRELSKKLAGVSWRFRSGSEAVSDAQAWSYYETHQKMELVGIAIWLIEGEEGSHEGGVDTKALLEKALKGGGDD